MEYVVFKSLFDKETRQQKALDKAVAKATNNKIKPDDRRPSLELLIHNGSKEAVQGLLGRLNFTYQNNVVADEDEKNYVYRGLVTISREWARRQVEDKGQGAEKLVELEQQHKQEVMLPALRAYLAKAPALSWGLRLVSDLCDKDETWQVCSAVLETFDPGYERDPSKKQQLFTFLRDLQHPAAVEPMLPFIEDHDETVRFLVIEALFAHPENEAAREPLLEQLVSEEEDSLRIRNRIAEGFIDNQWTVKGFRGQVQKVLEGEFSVDGKGRIKPKKGR